jgi:hypothetical protein
MRIPPVGDQKQFQLVTVNYFVEDLADSAIAVFEKHWVHKWQEHNPPPTRVSGSLHVVCQRVYHVKIPVDPGSF